MLPPAFVLGDQVFHPLASHLLQPSFNAVTQRSCLGSLK